MKSLPVLFLLLLAACGEPHAAPVHSAEPPSAASVFTSDDFTMIGAKCVALLAAPANGTPENVELKRRWQHWLDPQFSPRAIGDMVQLNTEALVPVPVETLKQAVSVCREKIEVVAPLN